MQKRFAKFVDDLPEREYLTAAEFCERDQSRWDSMRRAAADSDVDWSGLSYDDMKKAISETVNKLKEENRLEGVRDDYV